MYGLNFNIEEQIGGGSNLAFGLNPKNFMKAFGFNPNGGKEGAAQECLDIKFDVNGTEISYRQFPVTQAYDKNNNLVTDQNHPAIQEATKEFTAKITAILLAFVDRNVLTNHFNTHFGQLQPAQRTFQAFCNVAASVLPQNYTELPVDLFLEYQWQIKGTATQTYLQIPKKVKHGHFICKHMPGDFKPVLTENFEDRTDNVLRYVNAEGVTHLFVRGGWYMKSPFANQKKEASASNILGMPSASPIVPPNSLAPPPSNPGVSNTTPTGSPGTPPIQPQSNGAW